MELKEPEKQILDDFEHKVSGKIDKYGDEPDFPKLENYGITRMDLDDYPPAGGLLHHLLTLTRH